VDLEQAKARLSELIEWNDGHLTSTAVEQDEELAANRQVVSAAAHELATEPDITAYEDTDGREWFPFSGLVRSQ
jgi:hypothetical protein